MFVSTIIIPHVDHAECNVLVKAICYTRCIDRSLYKEQNNIETVRIHAHALVH